MTDTNNERCDRVKLRIKHKQLEHKARNVGTRNFGNNYNSNRLTKHYNPITTHIDLHSIIFTRAQNILKIS